MEDVLDLYEEEYDVERPVVCFDETSKQLVGHTRTPIVAEPGRLERIDYEYKRNGRRNLFMFCEPKSLPCEGRGWMETRGGHGAAHSGGLRASDAMTGR